MSVTKVKIVVITLVCLCADPASIFPQIDSLSFFKDKIRFNGLFQYQGINYLGGVGHAPEELIDKTTKYNIRRGRFGVVLKLIDKTSASAEIDISHKYSMKDPLLLPRHDSHPPNPVVFNLLSYEFRFLLTEKAYLRIGRFKAPFWREEMRDDRDLMLIERSRASRYLRFFGLSGYRTGAEAGFTFAGGFKLIANVSKTPLENHETYKNYFTKKSSKLNSYSGRIELPMFSNKAVLGMSIVNNTIRWAINDNVSVNTDISAFAPDLFMSFNSGIHDFEFEAGMTAVSGPRGGNLIEPEWFDFDTDPANTFADCTFRWKMDLSKTTRLIDWVSVSSGISYYSGYIGQYQFLHHPDYVKLRASGNGWFTKSGYTYRFGAGINLYRHIRFNIDYEIEEGVKSYESHYTKILRSQLSIII